MSLRLDWATHEAAKYACENWHYSKTIPVPPLVKIGVWEDEQYIGCVIFGRGASNAMLKPYGLDVTEGAELVRIALKQHRVPVSKIVSIAIKILKKSAPGLRLIVSYADPMQGHVGGIYQAGNWIYAGSTAPDAYYIDKNGRRWHSRTVSETGSKINFGRLRKCPKPSECKKVVTLPKHRYLMPLDAEIKRRLLITAKKYPKRVSSIENDAAGFQSVEGGAIPTDTLQNSQGDIGV